MASPPTLGDRPTRVAVDLLESAAAEGARESRSAKQQLDHWARVGRSVCAQETAGRRRIEAALTGSLPLADLSAEEAVVFNAEVQARIQERVRATDLGADLNASGVTTVSLDDEGRLVEHAPDGAERLLASS